MPMIDQFAQMKIDERAAQLEAVAQKESLGLAIKHDSVATIRKVGDDLMFTPDQLAFVVGEIKKCRKDIVYFAEKYFRIIGDGGLQLIKLYPKQKELLRTMQRESRVVCLASRQVGKCALGSVNIVIRNKKTGEIQRISFEDFYNMVKGQHESESTSDDM